MVGSLTKAKNVSTKTLRQKVCQYQIIGYAVKELSVNILRTAVRIRPSPQKRIGTAKNTKQL